LAGAVEKIGALVGGVVGAGPGAAWPGWSCGAAEPGGTARCCAGAPLVGRGVLAVGRGTAALPVGVGALAVTVGAGTELGLGRGVGRGVGRGPLITGLSGSTGPWTRGVEVLLGPGGKRNPPADCADAGCAKAASVPASNVIRSPYVPTRINTRCL
jgi:hypothetical protein